VYGVHHYILIEQFLLSSSRRHTSSKRDWSSDVCSSDLKFIGIQFEPVKQGVDIFLQIIGLAAGNLIIFVFFPPRYDPFVYGIQKIGRASCREIRKKLEVLL